MVSRSRLIEPHLEKVPVIFSWAFVSLLQIKSHSPLCFQSHEWGNTDRSHPKPPNGTLWHPVLNENVPMTCLYRHQDCKKDTQDDAQSCCMYKHRAVNMLRREWDNHLSASTGKPWLRQFREVTSLVSLWFTKQNSPQSAGLAWSPTEMKAAAFALCFTFSRPLKTLFSPHLLS